MTELHKVFVYGTLRDGKMASHSIQGWEMHAYEGRDFKFPYIVKVDEDRSYVYGNVIEVDDERLDALDKYENVRSGLFERIKMEVNANYHSPVEECWVYVAGPALLPTVVESGDWMTYVNNED